MTNSDISSLLRRVKTAYEILGENRFKIIAYDRAADSIDHLSSEAKDLWDDGKLSEVSGIGSTIAGHLDELFRTGHVRHFESVLSKIPQSIFVLLDVQGLGPKRAHKLVDELHLVDPSKAIDELEQAANAGKIADIEGFGEKSQSEILTSIALFRKGAIKEHRMLLSEALPIADMVLSHLSACKDVEKADILGSLRRKAPTIGDIDVSVATSDPKAVITHFLTIPYTRLIEQGPTGASIILENGHQVDLRVLPVEEYGSMLQYFTGSKNHNIVLRSYALTKGLSLSEYGIKNLKTGEVAKYPTEQGFYEALGLSYIPPELREDHGEIEIAKHHAIPTLVEEKDIRGDVHIHTDYNLEPSHDLGADPFVEYLKKAEQRTYEYIGISDHNPSVSMHKDSEIVDIMKARKEYYEQQYYSYISSTKSRVKLLLMCEVDILANGELALPNKAFAYTDGVIVSVHSNFRDSREAMTKRVVGALRANPKVRILGHPTGRLLMRREGYELDWDEVFSACKALDIALEVNANPYRLDLPDVLVKDAIAHGIRLIINSDAHAAAVMDDLPYGVAVARRGWATKHDIVNTMGYNEFAAWLRRT